MSEQTTSEKALQLFGRNVTRLREDRGWSVEQLAENAGLSVEVVGAYERGETSASLADQTRLARTFGVPLSGLVMGRK